MGQRIAQRFSKIVGIIFLVLVTAISVFPFYLVFIMSTYYNEDLYHGLPILPSDYLLGNLKTVMALNFPQIYANSLVVSLSAVLLATFTSSLIGFAVSKYEFKLRKAINYFIIVTMMVPGQISVIGYVMEMKALKLVDTLFPIILCWAAVPFGAFFMTQFIKDSVPLEIVECARLDGCSEPRIYWSIVLPFIRPGMATIAILVFLWSWNNYLLPLIVISKPKLYTIPLFVQTIGAEYRTDYAARMCALALAVFPVLIIFIIGSKTFIRGITAGAIKG